MTQDDVGQGRALALRLNAGPPLGHLDDEALLAHLGPEVAAMVFHERPNLFAKAALCVGRDELEAMERVIEAIERVVALPAYQEGALAQGPASASREAKARGAFLGYDFHLTPQGPQLIEVNTNAGGALLNAALLRAWRVEAPDGVRLEADDPREVERAIVEMFRQEHALAAPPEPLGRVVLVDEQPQTQFLWPEFVLFERLFARAGWEARAVDPSALVFEEGRLRLGGEPVSLVYNRLTDFGLDLPAHAALREAWLQGAAAITPHPRAHALYADKRNLVRLSDPHALDELGVDPETRALLLGGIPRTEPVEGQDPESLWSRRKGLFFKPAAGFGSRAAYRGDKLTKRVFDEILATGGYVAQTLAQPSERAVLVDGAPQTMKADLRCYVYAGRVQLVAARLYQGQTTNMRTPGGGFAPVLRA